MNVDRLVRLPNGDIWRGSGQHGSPGQPATTLEPEKGDSVKDLKPTAGGNWECPFDGQSFPSQAEVMGHIAKHHIMPSETEIDEQLKEGIMEKAYGEPEDADQA